MNRFMWIGLSVLVTTLAIPSAASAQMSGVGVRGVVTFGSTTFSSDQSFDAVLGEHGQTVWGVGGEATFWKGLFAGAHFSLNSELEGERVFVLDGEVFPLGIPVRIKVRPIDIVGGWRFQFENSRFSPFAGGGVSIVSYDESSDFAEAGDDVSESGTGYVLLFGADFALTDWLQVGGEFRYRGVSGALGEGGVSEEFGEDQLGGYTYSVRFVVGR